MEENNRKTVKPKTVKEYLRSRQFRKTVLFILIGGVAGFLYYLFVGCTTGSCPITSHPSSAIFVGGLLGYLISASF